MFYIKCKNKNELNSRYKNEPFLNSLLFLLSSSSSPSLPLPPSYPQLHLINSMGTPIIPTKSYTIIIQLHLISSTTRQILSYLSRLSSAVPSVGSGPHPPGKWLSSSVPQSCLVYFSVSVLITSSGLQLIIYMSVFPSGESCRGDS